MKIQGSEEKVNPQQQQIFNEKDHPINWNVNDSRNENKEPSKTNNKESFQQIKKENDSDEKDNLFNPR